MARKARLSAISNEGISTGSRTVGARVRQFSLAIQKPRLGRQIPRPVVRSRIKPMQGFAKTTMKNAYGYRTFTALQVALYHTLEKVWEGGLEGTLSKGFPPESKITR